MAAMTGPALVVAALLVVAGAQKVADPTMTVGALRALRLPASPVLVRVGSLFELLVGAVAIFVGGVLSWTFVAISNLAFAAFVSRAMRSGTPIGTCGCFGREETPPHWTHVALNVALASIAVAVGLTVDGAPVDDFAAHPGAAVVLVAMSALAVALLYLAFVELPRTLLAGRQ